MRQEKTKRGMIRILGLASLMACAALILAASFAPSAFALSADAPQLCVGLPPPPPDCTATGTCPTAPTDGACGTDNGASFAGGTLTSTDPSLCQGGTVTGFTGTGPWTWQCVGANGGSTASCAAILPQIPAVCGPAASAGPTATAPSGAANLCAQGTPGTVTRSGSSWIWICYGINNGANASCSEPVTPTINGLCGTDNGQSYPAPPNPGALTGTDPNLCVSGTVGSFTSTGTGWTWNCNGGGNPAGTTASCAASVGVNGVCGTVPGTCTAGTVSNVSDNGTTTTWTCTGSGTGSSASCSSPDQLNGACGSANGVSSATVPPAGLCSAGTPSVVTSSGGQWVWTCNGFGGGTAASCSAPQTCVSTGCAADSTIACGTAYTDNCGNACGIGMKCSSGICDRSTGTCSTTLCDTAVCSATSPPGTAGTGVVVSQSSCTAVTGSYWLGGSPSPGCCCIPTYTWSTSAWSPSPCPASCSQTRTVQCIDGLGNVYPNTDCINATGPFCYGTCGPMPLASQSCSGGSCLSCTPTCPAPSTVACGTTDTLDSCGGNTCSVAGTYCASGTCSGGVCSGGCTPTCPATSTVNCGTTDTLDSCGGNTCSVVGTYCASGTCSGGTCSGGCTPPTATLTANGSHSITVSVGATVNYSWSSTNGTSWSSSYTVDGSGGGAWTASTASGTSSGTIAASQAGHTYVITYTVGSASCGSASDSDTIVVNPCTPSCSATLACGSTASDGCGGTCTGTYCASGTCSGGVCSSYTYSWKCSGWGSCTLINPGTCSQTCTGGSYCQRSDGATVANSFCTGTAPTTQGCAAPCGTCNQACISTGYSGGTGCTDASVCGAGYTGLIAAAACQPSTIHNACCCNSGPVNGACDLSSASCTSGPGCTPTAACTTGTVSGVSTTGSYTTWTCNGSGGGSNASCRIANTCYQHFYEAVTPTGGSGCSATGCSFPTTTTYSTSSCTVSSPTGCPNGCSGSPGKCQCYANDLYFTACGPVALSNCP